MSQSKWLYHNGNKTVVLEEIPENANSFIYYIKIRATENAPDIIKAHDGMYYIGSKVFYNTLNKPLTKKETSALPKTRGKKKTKKEVIKESNWKTYNGSCKDEIYQKLFKKYPEYFEKLIIKIVYNHEWSRLYWEQKYLILFDWESNKCFNGNFNGKYFK